MISRARPLHARAVGAFAIAVLASLAACKSSPPPLPPVSSNYALPEAAAPAARAREERREEKEKLVFYVDKKFSAEDRTVVATAIDVWGRALAPYFDVTTTDDVKRANRFVYKYAYAKETSMLIAEVVANGSIYGYVDGIPGNVIHINADVIRANGHSILRTTLHEIGHSLGAEHTCQPFSLMSAPQDSRGVRCGSDVRVMNNFKCVDKETLEFVAAVQKLDPKRLQVACTE